MGAGAWGTALAISLSRSKNNTVYLNSYDQTHNKEMLAQKHNHKYLHGISFPEGLFITNNWKEIINKCSSILISVPSFCFYETLKSMENYLNSDHIIISATKGFCTKKNKLLSQLIAEKYPKNFFGILTGPSFAIEVAKNLPTKVIIASENIEYAKYIKNIFDNNTFSCCISNDIIGCQIGGAAKNVIAIACGISNGLGYGENARMCIITQGLKEIKNLGILLGGIPETFDGLSGLGDLVLTCSSKNSRNFSFGKLLGQGNSKQESLEIIQQTVEGIETTKYLSKIMKLTKINMPVCNFVTEVISNRVSVKEFKKLLVDTH